MRINTKLTGVSFGDRQKNIGLLPAGQTRYVLGWRRESDNPYDSNSVIVLAGPYSKIELGHLSREIAAKVAPLVDKGASMSIFLTGVTGKDKQTRGVNVVVEVNDGTTNNADAQN